MFHGEIAQFVQCKVCLDIIHQFSALRRYVPEIEILANTDMYVQKCIITMEVKVRYLIYNLVTMRRQHYVSVSYIML